MTFSICQEELCTWRFNPRSYAQASVILKTEVRAIWCLIRDQEDVDVSGARGPLAYDISQGLTTGANLSYNEAFDTRILTDLRVNFDGHSTTAAKKKVDKPKI